MKADRRTFSILVRSWPLSAALFRSTIQSVWQVDVLTASLVNTESKKVAGSGIERDGPDAALPTIVRNVPPTELRSPVVSKLLNKGTTARSEDQLQPPQRQSQRDDTEARGPKKAR